MKNDKCSRRLNQYSAECKAAYVFIKKTRKKEEKNTRESNLNSISK